jgi:hypothetical protein
MQWMVLQEDAAMKQTIFAGLLALATTLATAARAQSVTQLPINELYPCEVVLHELIAELRGQRAEAKGLLGGQSTTNDTTRPPIDEAAVRIWDRAIMLATRKMDRCP